MAKKKAKKPSIKQKMSKMKREAPHPGLWKGPNIGKRGVVQ